MSQKDFSSRLYAILAVGVLALGGCGQPEGAGTVDMAAAKKAAMARGIPEAKRPEPSGSSQGKPPANPKPIPNKPLPRGGR
jgi:hypothetical protein